MTNKYGGNTWATMAPWEHDSLRLPRDKGPSMGEGQIRLHSQKEADGVGGYSSRLPEMIKLNEVLGRTKMWGQKGILSFRPEQSILWLSNMLPGSPQAMWPWRMLCWLTGRHQDTDTHTPRASAWGHPGVKQQKPALAVCAVGEGDGGGGGGPTVRSGWVWVTTCWATNFSHPQSS